MILENGLLKILDFGLAKENIVSNIYSDSRVGTSGYKAPELFGVASNN
jgi:serine/threonine protein kinase